MAISKLDRLKLLLGEDFQEPTEDIEPQSSEKPAHTDDQLSAAVPDTTRSPNAPLDLASLDIFHGPAYNNTDLELVGISSSDDEAGPGEVVKIPEKIAGPSTKHSSIASRVPHVDIPARTSGKPTKLNVVDDSDSENSPSLFTFGPETGRLADAQSFIPIVNFSKFPYKYIRPEYSELVADKFWNAGKFWERSWDIYYIWPPQSVSGKPLLLISLAQAENLIREVNQALSESHIALPSGAREIGLLLTFAEHPDIRPRHLGRSTTRSQYTEMEQHVPRPVYKPDNEPKAAKMPDDRSLEAFKEMMELAMDANRAKNKANKSKKKEEKTVKQQNMGRQLKRVERYLGLRPKRQHLKPYSDPNESWERIQEAQRINDEEAHMKPIDPEEKAPYPFESWVVFVCADVEAYERANNLITEIGISTLDTWEVKDIPPGKNGDNWEKKIRKRHFLIKEHAHLVNREFVAGCPDRFEFGESELIGKNTAPQMVASCFKYPFSAPEPSLVEADSMRNSGIDLQKRTIIFVGHDITNDIEYLQKLGYNPLNLGNLREHVDTGHLYRYLKRAPNPGSLGSMLYDFGMTGWNLHNAGNDAAYTLHAMLAIAVKHCEMRGSAKLKEEFTEAYRKREQQLLDEARERAREEQEGWDSAEDDDGGMAPSIHDVNANVRQARQSKGGNFKGNA